MKENFEGSSTSLIMSTCAIWSVSASDSLGEANFDDLLVSQRTLLFGKPELFGVP
jgi:hypothetical protein